ncbi:MAG: amidohydrolase family protein [Candidatus Hadarchaeum sp.]
MKSLDLILRKAKLRSGEVRDIGIKDGKIVEISGKIKKRSDKEINVDERLTTPAFVNLHVHLDKSLIGDAVGGNVDTCEGGIRRTWEYKKRYTVQEIKKRANQVVDLAVVYGCTRIRAFADVDTIGGLNPVKALLEIKKERANHVDLQVVAFPQEGILKDEGTEDLLYQAMELGADVVGGIPWIEFGDDQKRHVDIVFDIAKRFGADIHMLVDDTDDPTSRTLEYFAYKAIKEKYFGRVSASHAGALAAYDNSHAARVIQMVRDAEMTIVSNPHISLMLNGRRDVGLIRRGITRVKEFLEAGVNVATAQDDVNDPYYPFGKMDQLEVGFLMAHVAQLGTPAELEKVYDMITLNGAKAMRYQDYGLQAGKTADIVIIDADNIKDAFRFQPVRLYVIKNGKIIAASTSKKKIIKI